MPFSEKLKNEIQQYCTNHLATDLWYARKFSFIQDIELKNRIISEFKAIRFAYKLYEGIEAKDENLIFEIRNQIFAYASIYEAVIESILNTYYSNTDEFDTLSHVFVPTKISIPRDKLEVLQKALSHDGKEITPVYYSKKKKEKSTIRFDDKCRTAEKLGLIHKFSDKNGKEVDLVSEIIEIYSYRNGIHILAEKRKGINYELELSKKAYRRMKPFIEQITTKLISDGKIQNDSALYERFG